MAGDYQVPFERSTVQSTELTPITHRVDPNYHKPIVTKHCCDKCNSVSKDKCAEWVKSVFQTAAVPKT